MCVNSHSIVSARALHLMDAFLSRSIFLLVIRYETPQHILEEFFQLRMEFYHRRRINLLAKLHSEKSKLDNKVHSLYMNGNDVANRCCRTMDNSRHTYCSYCNGTSVRIGCSAFGLFRFLDVLQDISCKVTSSRCRRLTSCLVSDSDMDGFLSFSRNTSKFFNTRCRLPYRIVSYAFRRSRTSH